MPVNHLSGTRQENVKPRVGEDIVYKYALAFLNGGSGDADTGLATPIRRFITSGPVKRSTSGYTRGRVPDRQGISGSVEEDGTFFHAWPPTITSVRN